MELENLFKDDKTAEYHKDAFLVPSFTDKKGRKIEAVAYDNTYTLIETSKSNEEYKSGEYIEHLDINVDNIEVVEGKSIYIGKLTNKFSQFFFDSLSRVKSLMRIRSFNHVIYTLDESMPLFDGDKMYEPISTFFDAFNIDRDKLILLDKPMKFSSLRIPVNEVSDHNVPDSLSLERVINRMTSFGYKNYPSIADTWNSKIYVTSRNKPNNKNFCRNEIEIENYFLSEGYSILDPYTTPFVQQLAIYDNTQKLIAIENEVILNHIYCRKDRELIVLSKGGDVSYEKKLLALNYEDETKLKYILFQNIQHHSDGSFEYSLDDIKTGINSELQNVFIRPLINKEGVDCYSVLNHIDNKLSGDHVFFQIGNNKAVTQSNGKCHVVSPLLKISSEQIGEKKEISFHQKSSTNFFIEESNNVFAKEKIDLAYIDGPRKPKKLIKDILNTEAHSNKDGKILIPNILTDINFQHNKKDDLWKAAFMLKTERRDLKLTFIDANPSGILIVENLNALFHKQNPEEFASMIQNVNRIDDSKFDEFKKSIKVIDSKEFTS